MLKVPTFLIVWLLNAVTLYFVFILFPGSIVLGNFRYEALLSAVVAGLIWTGIVWVIRPILSHMGLSMKKESEKTIFYTVANFIAIWITARLAPVSGLGISSFGWAIFLALVGEAIQLAVWNLAKLKS